MEFDMKSTCQANRGANRRCVPPAVSPRQGRDAEGNDADVPGFYKSSTAAEIALQGQVITPGRYVGTGGVADDGEPFAEKMPRLVADLHAQSAKLEHAINANLRGLGY